MVEGRATAGWGIYCREDDHDRCGMSPCGCPCHRVPRRHAVAWSPRAMIDEDDGSLLSRDRELRALARADGFRVREPRPRLEVVQ